MRANTHHGVTALAEPSALLASPFQIYFLISRAGIFASAAAHAVEPLWFACAAHAGRALRKTVVREFATLDMLLSLHLSRVLRRLERECHLTVSFRAKGDAVRPIMTNSNARVFQCALPLTDDNASAAQATSAPARVEPQAVSNPKHGPIVALSSCKITQVRQNSCHRR
jgi:hypothetical protein